MMRIELYRRWTMQGRQWFWRARSTRNGNIMAIGGEGYWNKDDALEAIGKVQCSLPLAGLVVIP